MAKSLFEQLRPATAKLPESGIVAVANHGRNKDGLIPLWVGEGDLPTPKFIADAATASLARGETFYTWQRGIPELRQALADYHTRLYGRKFIMDEFFITGSGMQAMQLAVQAVAGVGDEAIVPSPAWPNMHAALSVMGAKPVEILLDFAETGWRLDLNRLENAITPKTCAISINSPGNPTGWMADRQTLQGILVLARKYGLWIIADEVYCRFTYDNNTVASFHDIANSDDQIIFVNTFSKNWAMTGWRIGWISASPELGQVFENLIQYSTSGVAPFMQHAAIAALEQGEDFLSAQLAKARKCRDIVTTALRATGKTHFAVPNGAFYLFFSITGIEDTTPIAFRLVDEANVGLAPGSAFGAGGDSYLRLCFLRDPIQLQQGVERLVNWLETKI